VLSKQHFVIPNDLYLLPKQHFVLPTHSRAQRNWMPKSPSHKKDQVEEAVDVAGKVFMRLYLAACKCGLVRREFGSATRTFSAFVVACGSATRAMSRSTTNIAISQSICLVRHVAADTSKTRKVDASATAGDGKSTQITRNTWGVSPCARSTQIRGAVSVRQESLIH
jgi:hypothetical protein